MGSKGADEVTSMLNHFIFYVLDPQVKHLEIFCDSCSEQNKNYLVIKFCHYVVSFVKRLESIKITFPIRGHSYMECDRNMSLINQKSPCEVPEDWVNVIQNGRMPSPFQVFSVDYPFFRDWNSFLAPHYMKKNPIATRPVTEILFQSEHSRLVEHRSSFNGHWESTPIRLKQSSAPLVCPDFTRKEFFLPDPLRKEPKPISEEKFKDLQHLKQFCGPATKSYFDKLPHAPKPSQAKSAKAKPTTTRAKPKTKQTKSKPAQSKPKTTKAKPKTTKSQAKDP